MCIESLQLVKGNYQGHVGLVILLKFCAQVYQDRWDMFLKRTYHGDENAAKTHIDAEIGHVDALVT